MSILVKRTYHCTSVKQIITSRFGSFPPGLFQYHPEETRFSNFVRMFGRTIIYITHIQQLKTHRASPGIHLRLPTKHNINSPMALPTYRMLFKFFTSLLVPSGSPGWWIETLASTLIEPSTGGTEKVFPVNFATPYHFEYIMVLFWFKSS